MAGSDFRKIKTILIQRNIHFVPNDAEPRFVIQGTPFTTQELIQIERQHKLTNLDLPEIIENKRRSP